MVALPFYLQQACGYNDVETGLLLTAWPAVIMVVAPAAGLLVERIHAGLLGGTGLTMMAAGLFLLAFLPEHPTDFDIIWRLVLCGAGFGLFQSPNNSILIASAPPERSGSASGMLATARLAGQTTGAALMALLFHVVPENSTHTALLLADRADSRTLCAARVLAERFRKNPERLYSEIMRVLMSSEPEEES